YQHYSVEPLKELNKPEVLADDQDRRLDQTHHLETRRGRHERSSSD
ncbi:MAG: hypothetical protein K0R29_2606, partial [Pseudobdellovibrio sp.]|nr:hypothetical protein [Pseudobdellovibrio sp.]